MARCAPAFDVNWSGLVQNHMGRCLLCPPRAPTLVLNTQAQPRLLLPFLGVSLRAWSTHLLLGDMAYHCMHTNVVACCGWICCRLTCSGEDKCLNPASACGSRSSLLPNEAQRLQPASVHSAAAAHDSLMKSVFERASLIAGAAADGSTGQAPHADDHAAADEGGSLAEQTISPCLMLACTHLRS